MSKIKICGLSRMEDILAVNEYKPDYIGFVFAAGSKRHVSPQKASELKAALDRDILAVGVFVNSPVQEIFPLVQEKIIDLIQLHGDEDAAYVDELRHRLRALPGSQVPIIQAVRVNAAGADTPFADTIFAKAAAFPADYLLFDTCIKGQYGGSGVQFDWDLIPPMEKPYFLAGGINASNIKRAFHTPAYCIDLSSAVETDGYKDPQKIREIISIVRSV